MTFEYAWARTDDLRTWAGNCGHGGGVSEPRTRHHRPRGFQLRLWLHHLRVARHQGKQASFNPSICRCAAPCPLFKSVNARVLCDAIILCIAPLQAFRLWKPRLVSWHVHHVVNAAWSRGLCLGFYYLPVSWAWWGLGHDGVLEMRKGRVVRSPLFVEESSAGSCGLFWQSPSPS